MGIGDGWVEPTVDGGGNVRLFISVSTAASGKGQRGINLQ